MSHNLKKIYSYSFLLPAGIIYGLIFVIPTLISFFFSLTRWTLMDWKFIGFENFVTFFYDSSLGTGLKNTLIYAGLTCGLKVVIALLIAVYLCRELKTKNFLRTIIFFPSLISTIAVGLAFSSMMHPATGLINRALSLLGITGPSWLADPGLALFSVILVDVWKGIGVSMVIYIAGIMSIPLQYYEALKCDGGNAWQKFIHITLPLVRPAMNSIIILSLVSGLRSFDLVWAMTNGGPGFASDVLASVIYKQYVSGFYGLSTAGNVVLFIVVSLIAFPLYKFLNREKVEY